MNAQLRRVYLRGFLEKTAQLNKEEDIPYGYIRAVKRAQAKEDFAALERTAKQYEAQRAWNAYWDKVKHHYQDGDQESTPYTPSLDSVISGVAANRKGQVRLEAERQRLSSVNKARSLSQIDKARGASRDFEDAEKHLKRSLSREQFAAVKPTVRERSQSLKNTLGLRKDQYKIENPGLFDRMAVNLFGPKEDAVIKREARKLVAPGGVPAVPGAKPYVAPPASGANPYVAPPASGAKPW